MTALLVLMFTALAAAIAYGLWRHFRSRPAPVAFEFAPPPPPRPEPALEPEPVTASVALILPSRFPQFQFTCQVQVSYVVDQLERQNPDLIRLAELALYGTARTLASNFSLTEKDRLLFELNHEIRAPQTITSVRMTVRGYCTRIEVEQTELELVRKLERRRFEWEIEQEEDNILRRRIEYLARIFEDPRIATLWWFAQNQGKIDELPTKAGLLYELDDRFNGRESRADQAGPSDSDGKASYCNEPPEPARSDFGVRDFLRGTDEGGESALALMLANVYRSHGRDDLAEEVLRNFAPPDTPVDNTELADAEPSF